MMSYLFGHFVPGRGSVGLLIVRLVFGLGMVLHGSQKIGAPLTWMNAFAGENAPPGFRPWRPSRNSSAGWD